ncbi:MAG: Xaa-Pro peptidase family protein [Peptostreptococcaceae bacterium]|nr:Xaa-Pro peptidase family protein [Peptostreptococcaceae bacterium]
MHEKRVERVLQRMKEEQIGGLLVSDPASIFYLTGAWIHPGERLLVLYLSEAGDHKLFINELFPVTRDLGVEKVWFKDTDDAVQILADHIGRVARLGIDKNWPSGFLLQFMQDRNDVLKNQVSLFSGYFDEEIEWSYVNGSPIIDRLRMCKDEEEREFMRVASRLNDQAMGKLIGALQEGKTEQEMARKLADIYEEIGAEGFSFEPIVAYGVNGADPHHEPDRTPLREGDLVILDVGCRKDSYCSDMTRTVFFRSASEKAQQVHTIVREANEKAIAKVRPGVKFSEIDAAARSHIEQAGYGQYFTHRTGHCIGIDVHDFGNVSAANHDEVAEGMIFSIEPGIYLPGEFGVRIEDLVLVTKEGCEVLNQYDKGIIIAGK